MSQVMERQVTASDIEAMLSTRELEILLLLAADGLDTRTISERLEISHHTVRTHVGHILRTLDVHSQLEAVVLAWRAGLVERYG